MHGPGVYECADFRYVKGQKGNMWHKGIWVKKSGHIEAGHLGCTSRVNAACQLCGGPGAAYSFFDSELAPKFESVLPDSSAMATAQALAFLDFFGQLSVKCPVPSQNMQRLLLSHCLCSSAVSLLSSPSLLVKSSFELEEDWLLVTLDKPEVLAELGELLVLA